MKRCRKHDWRYVGQHAHPRGSRYGVVLNWRCELCGKRSTKIQEVR